MDKPRIKRLSLPSPEVQQPLTLNNFMNGWVLKSQQTSVTLFVYSFLFSLMRGFVPSRNNTIVSSGSEGRYRGRGVSFSYTDSHLK